MLYFENEIVCSSLVCESAKVNCGLSLENERFKRRKTQDLS